MKCSTVDVFPLLAPVCISESYDGTTAGRKQIHHGDRIGAVSYPMGVIRRLSALSAGALPMRLGPAVLGLQPTLVDRTHPRSFEITTFGGIGNAVWRCVAQRAATRELATTAQLVPISLFQVEA